MSINAKDVEHIADLARIKLSEEEKIKLEKDISGILKFVDTLNELNTDGTSPMTGGTILLNEVRIDEPDKELQNKADALLSQIPLKRDRWASVKAVFESH